MHNQEDIIEQIESLCGNLYINEDKTENIINLIRASLPSNNEISVLPKSMDTGFIPFDYLLSPIANNSRIHIFGREGSAKTSLIVHFLEAITSKYNTKALWLDSTFKLDAKFLSKFQIENSVDLLLTSRIENSIVDLLADGKYRVIVLDDITSFQKESISKLEKIFYLSKLNNIIVIALNQLRQNPNNGKTYAPIQDLMTNYDVVLQTSKYAVHYQEGYNDFDLKLLYHKQRGEMQSKNIIIPITKIGLIKQDLLEKRIKAIASAAGFESIENLIAHRKISSGL